MENESPSCATTAWLWKKKQWNKKQTKKNMHPKDFCIWRIWRVICVTLSYDSSSLVEECCRWSRKRRRRRRRRRLSSLPSVQLCPYLSALPKPIKFTFSRPLPNPTPCTHTQTSALDRISVCSRNIKGRLRRNCLVEGGPPPPASVSGPPANLFCCVTFFFFLSSLLRSFFSSWARGRVHFGTGKVARVKNSIWSRSGCSGGSLLGDGNKEERERTAWGNDGFMKEWVQHGMEMSWSQLISTEN